MFVYSSSIEKLQLDVKLFSSSWYLDPPWQPMQPELGIRGRSIYIRNHKPESGTAWSVSMNEAAATTRSRTC